MYIKRDFEEQFCDAMISRKVLIIYGARQTGKTTVIEKLLRDCADRFGKAAVFNGDIKAHRDMLRYDGITPEKVKSMIGDAQTVFVDEAQKILDIGLTLKIIHDNLPEVYLVATGSSSFELSEELGEPLTGRMRSFVLPPLSFHELAESTSNISEMAQLEARLRLGSYPDVVTAGSETNTIENLNQFCEAYLFKDVLTWEGLKSSQKLENLLRALALQVGNEVSYNELGGLVGCDNETVKSYIERLEKCFVVFRLPAFARNMRTELKKSRKVYFGDTGVRNAVLGNYLPLDCREDVGHLFENYLIVERMKDNNFKRKRTRCCFWRTTTPSDGEIDYIEESADGGISAYEFKFNPAKAKKAKCPEKFRKNYPDARWTVVSRDNYPLFVNGEL